jgi:CTP:molybdopterin cytidylyltransferase MocA
MTEPLSLVAVVPAGSSPSEDDLLAEYSQGKPKALIPIAGKPMIAHVVEALAGSRYVKHILFVALDPAAVGVQFPVPVGYVPDAGGLMENNLAGFEQAQARYPDLDGVLLSGCDVPTLTPAIVDAFIEECFRTDHDIYYSMVERSVMETRFPNSRRSYVHLREGDLAGGDILLVRPGVTFDQQELGRKLARARKSALRQARMVGLGTFLKLLLHRLSIADAERRAHEVFDLRVRVVPFRYAEIGMDVDKPFQLEIVCAELEARTAVGR